ncbi:GNAT family N-acetyltransferase [Exiguobacterium sp. s193]|uniref:GNAT family N-acetyltransferase n=1 Tax=Exiguobacterium sp. s193 TaxID=2751207 RepID=UPI001BE76FC5|nr:GNAT family N-acetyltransferase [Exiguobacterium sp. s193]
MIRRLTPTDFQNLFQLQQQAYQIEASLIGAPDFPPLRQTFDEFTREAPTGYVYVTNARLLGCLTYSGDTITRLIVSPDFFRRGVATQLLTHALQEIDLRFVSTAKANIPAVRLYHQFGFLVVSMTNRHDIQLVHLERT